MFLKPHEEGHEKKSTFVSRFHSSFNAAYDSLLNSYKNRVVFFIQKKWLSFGIVAGCIVLLVVLMNATPTGMVPNEDTGTIMGAVTLPPGTSQELSLIHILTGSFGPYQSHVCSHKYIMSCF